MSDLIIETRDLVKIYGDGAEVRALDGVNMRVERGEFLAVMGPSGSGKSTLLNMIGALDRPTSGQVLVNGQDLAVIRDLDRFRARTVGFVFQLHNLIPTLNAQENVAVPLIGLGVGARERRARAEELLELVGLGNRMDHLPSQLSGGQRQRVAIARSLANEPALVLADEPTGNLDSESGGAVVDLLRRLNAELDTTFVIVTHDLTVARQTDRVLDMRDGQIADDHHVGHPFEEDLKAFRASGLGQAILQDEEDARAVLDPATLQAVQRLLDANGA
ncbi:MAG: ATP-binding cassette domain-containing protein [Chloroflexi bacterium]|jgi:ABC-type lipoprotein export system ATPase subunit|nr:ATP-binding cassette domain-containing protein [Chloroflexota bacterium]